MNRSHQAIDQLYVSPSDSDQWGDNRLGRDSVHPGGSFRLRLPRTTGCNVDVQVIYRDARQEERNGVNLCRSGQVSFDASAAAMPPEAAGPAHDVTVSNQNTRAIALLFLSDPGAQDWGDNRLTAGPVAVGTKVGIDYRGPCGVDMRVVFDNLSAEERRGIDICAQSDVVVRPGWTTEAGPAPPSGLPPPGSTPASPAVPPGPAVASQPAGNLATPAAAPPAAPNPPETVIEMIDVTNRSAAPITALELSPENGSGGPRQDLLAGEPLPRGGHLVLPFTRGPGCRYTALVRHPGDMADQKMAGIDLCRESEITVPAG
ncbi:MAG TPA: hypothetical protein VGH36_12265 [Acetobacteraceae bacterium]